MRTTFIITMSLIATPIHAETYLCLAEAGAYVKENAAGSFEPGVANVEDQKYVLTNENGKWVVKMLGQDSAMYDDCDGRFWCEHSEGWRGIFWRKENGTFTVVFPTGKDGDEYMVTAKGRCSLIE